MPSRSFLFGCFSGCAKRQQPGSDLPDTPATSTQQQEPRQYSKAVCPTQTHIKDDQANTFGVGGQAVLPKYVARDLGSGQTAFPQRPSAGGNIVSFHESASSLQLSQLNSQLLSLEGGWFEKLVATAQRLASATGAVNCTIHVLDETRSAFIVLCSAGTCWPCHQPGVALPALRAGPGAAATSLHSQHAHGVGSLDAAGQEPQNSLQLLQTLRRPLMHCFANPAASSGGTAALPPSDWQALHEAAGVTDIIAVPLRCFSFAVAGAVTLTFRCHEGHAHACAAASTGGPGTLAGAASGMSHPGLPTQNSAAGMTGPISTQMTAFTSTSFSNTPAAPAARPMLPEQLAAAGASAGSATPQGADAAGGAGAGATPALLCCHGSTEGELLLQMLGMTLSMATFGNDPKLVQAAASLLADLASSITLQQLVQTLTHGTSVLLAHATKLPLACYAAVWPSGASHALFFEDPSQSLHGLKHASSRGLEAGSSTPMGLRRQLSRNAMAAAAAAASWGAGSACSSDALKTAPSRLQRSHTSSEARNPWLPGSAVGPTSPRLSQGPLESSQLLDLQSGALKARAFELRNTLLQGLSESSCVVADCVSLLQQVTVPKRDLYLVASSHGAPPQSLAMAAAPLDATLPRPGSATAGGGGGGGCMAPPSPAGAMLLPTATSHSLLESQSLHQPRMPGAGAGGGNPGNVVSGVTSCLPASLLNTVPHGTTISPHELASTGGGGHGAHLVVPFGQLVLYLVSSIKVPSELLVAVQSHVQQLLAAMLAPAVARKLAQGGGIADEWQLLVTHSVTACGSNSRAASTASTHNAMLAAAAAAAGSADIQTSALYASTDVLTPPTAPGAMGAHGSGGGGGRMLLHGPVSPLATATAAVVGAAPPLSAQLPQLSTPVSGSQAEGTRTHMAMLVESYRHTLNTMQAARPNDPEELNVLTLGSVLGRGGSGLVVQGKLYGALEVAAKLFENPDDADPAAAAAASLENSGPGGGAAGRDGEPGSSLPLQLSKRHRDLLRNALELAVASSLSHPNIVQGYCHWVNVVLMQDAARKRCWLVTQEEHAARTPEGTPPPPLCSVLVMEYCDAGTLLHAVARGAFNTPGSDKALNMEALYMCLMEVALALRHLHSAKIAHCDVKPGNILLRSLGRDPRGFTCKLGDFGYVALLKDGLVEGKATTMPTEACGTLQYMAPELFVSGRPVDASIDIYSFGLLMWELTSGKTPFSELELSSKQLMRAVYQGRRPTFADHVPAAYRQLAAMCWSGNPDKRPTAAMLVKVLRQRIDACKQQAAAAPYGVARQAAPAERARAASAGAGAGGV